MDRVRTLGAGGATTVVTTAPSPRVATVTLRAAAPPPAARHVGFAGDVVDNEFLGRRKSKCACCEVQQLRAPVLLPVRFGDDELTRLASYSHRRTNAQAAASTTSRASLTSRRPRPRRQTTLTAA